MKNEEQLSAIKAKIEILRSQGDKAFIYNEPISAGVSKQLKLENYRLKPDRRSGTTTIHWD